MGDIATVITVDAEGAIASVDALAASVEKLAADWDAAMSKLKIPDITAGGNLGFDKLTAQAEAAAAKIEASFARIGEAAKSLADVGESGAAGLGKLTDAENAASEGADRLAKSTAPLEDTLKGVGDQTKQNSAWLDEYNATMAESAKTQADFARISADSSAKVAESQRLQTAAARDNAADAVAAQKAQRDAAAESAAAAEESSHRWKMAGLAGLAVVAYGVDQAAKLQTGITRLQTTAGESAKNLPMISAGILKLAPETATSQAQLLQGAYMAESAGFHGQSALNVVKAAAEGAYAEGAPLSDTTNALTSLLNAYGMKGPKAPVSAMDQIIAMVSRGKMTMAGAVAALPTVLPTAASAGLNFGQVGGALATMTAMGASPDLAAQHLNYTVSHLQNMSSVQTKEIQQLGGDPVALEKNLGKTGLLGTLTDINKLVTGSMGPSGLVMMKTFNQSASAAADANKMISAMPPAIRGVATAYEQGKISAKQWNAEVYSGSESAQNKNLLQQFATVENQAKGFNDLLKSGSPAAQTYLASISKALGGEVGAQTFLQLMGIHLPAAQANTAAVTAAGQHPGANVTGWSDVQKTLKFQLGSAEQGLQSVVTELGKAALPSITTGLKGLADVAKFFAGHQDLTKALGIGGGALLGVNLAKQFSTSLANQLGNVGKMLHIPGSDKLSNLGKGTGLDSAATSLDGAGGSLKAAAGDLSAAAEKLSTGSGVPGGGGPLSTAEKDAGGGGLGADAENAAKDVGEIASVGVLAKLGNLFKGGGGLDVESLMSKSNPIIAGITAGLMLRGFGDSKAPKGTPAGAMNQWLQQGGAGGSQAMNHYLGGLESWFAFSNAGLDVGRWMSEQERQKAGPPPSTVPSGVAPSVYSRFGPSAGSAPATPRAPAAVPVSSEASPLLGLGGHPGTMTIKPKVEPPDTGAISAALAKIGQLAGQIKPVKMPAPDMSALDGAKGKAAADAAAIIAAISSGVHKPVKAAPPDISAYQAAVGPARADGANISAGLAAGIMSGEGAVVAAAQAVAAAASAAMASALKTHSPSKVTEKTGKEFDAGFVVGLQGGKDAVDAAAAAIGKTAAKAADIASIDSYTQKLLKQVPKGDTALTAMLKADNKDLDNMARQRARLEAEISDSEQVAKSAVSGASIMNSLTAVNPAGNEPIASAAVVTGQGYQAASLKQFAQALQKDKALGLNATSLSQIAQAGPDQGLGIAQGIASGGKDAVKQLNAIQKQIQASSAQIGNVAGPAMYQAGQDVAKGLASGLKAELGSLDKAMEHLAKSMVAAVKSNVKKAKEAAHKAGAATAKDTAAGAASGASAASGGSAAAVAAAGRDRLGAAAAGLSAAGSSLSAAAGALSAAAANLSRGAAGGSGAGGAGGGSHPGGGTGRIAPGAPAYGGGHYGTPAYLPSFGGGGQQHYHQHVNVTVQGSVTTERDLLNTMQEAQLQRSSNNWQSGWQLPGHPN